MELAIAIHTEKLKALPRRIKVAGGVAIGGLLLIAVAFLINDVLGDQEAEVARSRSRLIQLRQQSAELRRQVDQYPQLRQRYQDALDSGLMTSLDRVGLVNEAQNLATRFHLADLQYKLEAQDSKSVLIGRYKLGATTINFDSGALLDTDALAFWDALLAALPAHYQVSEASLERTADVTPTLLNRIRQGQPETTVKVKLSLRWEAMHSNNRDSP
jgi:hypothetical protein